MTNESFETNGLEQVPPQTPVVSKEDRLWSIGAHVSTFLTGSIPFINFIGPLVVYLAKKDESEYAAEHAREALNFQISTLIYYIISGILLVVGIGFVLMPLVWGLSIVATIVAAIKAAEGEVYRYPCNIRFL